MSQRLVLLSGAMLLLAGCSTFSSDVANHVKCPEYISKFNKGVATSGFVEQCMGKPVLTDTNPDGRYIYVYQATQEGVPVYLFNSEHKLINAGNYQDEVISSHLPSTGK